MTSVKIFHRKIWAHSNWILPEVARLNSTTFFFIKWAAKVLSHDIKLHICCLKIAQNLIMKWNREKIGENHFNNLYNIKLEQIKTMKLEYKTSIQNSSWPSSHVQISKLEWSCTMSMQRQRWAPGALSCQWGLSISHLMVTGNYGNLNIGNTAVMLYVTTM